MEKPLERPLVGRLGGRALSGVGDLIEPGGPGAVPDSSFLDVWVLSVSGVRADQADVSVLDERERRRAAKFVREADRHSYLSAHIGLRQVLSRRLGAAPGQLEFIREACPNCGAAHGRPALAGHPLHFSLSHGGDLVLVAVAGAPVGVDVEPVPDEQVAVDLSARLHPDEQREVAAAPDLRSAFARMWTRKEAYLKGIGTGLSRSLRADYLGSAGLAALPSGWSVLDVPVPAGHAGAVAVRGAAPEIWVRDLPATLIEGDVTR